MNAPKAPASSAVSRRAFLQSTALGVSALALARPLGVFAAASGPKIPMAMNLSGIADWEPGFPFVNLMWGARAWMSRNETPGGPWNTEAMEHCPLDENGYPLEVPFSAPGRESVQHVFTIVPTVLAPGEYVLLHEGEGEIEGLMNTRVLEAAPGRILLEMAHKGRDQPEGIIIKSSVKGNHLRNMRLVPLAQEQADLDANPFRPEFLEFCKPFHALRFMDWVTTNNSLEREWSRRKKRTFYTMVGAGGDPFGMHGRPADAYDALFSGGVSIDVIIQLANTVKIAPWLCVPHLATDEYIREYAKLVKERLDPSLKVYLEFSNEIWNWQFQQAQWMLRSKWAGDHVVEKGGSAWEGDPVFKYGDGTVAEGGGTGHPERIGALFRRCFGIWEEVFSGADRARLVTVCASQASWHDVVKRTLRWVMDHGGCDALSVAGYFGPNDTTYRKWDAAGASLTADEVIADMQAALEETDRDVTYAGDLASEHGVKLVMYEGGQHIQPKGQAELPYMPALKEAQTHPGMYDVYMRNFEIHQKNRCALFGVFASIGQQGSRWGSWGHLAYYGQPLSEAPKMRAVLDANTPRT